MDILKSRYDEMIRAELTLNRIREIVNYSGEVPMTYRDIVDHVRFLLEVYDEKIKK